eukprot:4046858-Prymnesium_polylepis.1
MCQSHAEGLGCYMTRAAPGFGLNLWAQSWKPDRPPYFLWTQSEWIDVRKHGSPRFLHWFEVSAEISFQEQRPVILFSAIGIPYIFLLCEPKGVAADFFCEKSVASQADVKDGLRWEAATVEVASGGESIAWASLDYTAVAMPSPCAKLTSWRWHMHGRGTLRDMWLLRGSSKSLRLSDLLSLPETPVEIYPGQIMVGSR